jgi:hypothetical protein
MCRLVSSTPAQGGLGLHVMMLDTTGDLAGGGQAGGQSFKDVRDVTDYAFHHFSAVLRVNEPCQAFSG